MVKKTAAVLIAMTILVAGCDNKKNTEAPKQEEVVKNVKYIEAKSFNKDINTNFSGTISAVSETKLSFKVNGNIKKIYFKMGEKIKQGQLLAEIDSKDYSLQFQNAENNLENAKIGIAESKAKLEQANVGYEQAKNSVEQSKTAVENAKVQYSTILKKYERISKLYEEGNASAEDFENVKLARDSAKLNVDNANNLFEQAKTGVKNALATIEQSKAGVNSAEATVNTVSKNVEMAKLQVDYTKLYSPVDGDVIMKLAEENENIAAGMPVLVINSGNNFEVKIFVPEIIIAKLKEGEKVDVKVDAVEGKIFKGYLKEVGTTSTGFGTTFPVTITLKDIQDKLRAGMTAEAILKLSNNTNIKSVYVPSHVVGKDTTGNYIYIIETQDRKSGILKKRSVAVGDISSKGIEIVKGIRDGEIVLGAGLKFADEGMRVRLIEGQVE